ncbi:Trehalose-6-P synthase/phosphatase complex synthase subunit [Clavispora lusitaniae]|nr:Trehalose-6-P synthase/phosphatase complex synthase subunit [Clavispora lusitaniae]
MSQGKVLVVSNRLPVTITKKDDGSYDYSMSSGGLVTALQGLKKSTEFQWLGWPGLEIPEAEQETMNKDLMDKFKCTAIFLSDTIADLHYNGFSNSILWPLFHYHPGEMNFDENAYDRTTLNQSSLHQRRGVPQKLHAFEVFLQENPEWIGKVVLVQVAVPSRGDVEEYQNLRATVNELVGRINGQFGTVEFVPIHYHESIPG